jgi:hypothetical protein
LNTLAKPFLALLPLALAGCVATAPTLVERTDLPPIPTDYRSRISTWARGFFADPHSLRNVRISEPVPLRDSTGRLLWLVCLQADASTAGGAPLGDRLFAFGFVKGPPDIDGKPQEGLFSAPLRRGDVRIGAEDCTGLPLSWSPWPDLGRSGKPALGTR